MDSTHMPSNRNKVEQAPPFITFFNRLAAQTPALTIINRSKMHRLYPISTRWVR